MNTKITPKDFFLHLGATVALYISAGALISLSFSVINYMFPDKLAGSFYAPSIAWPISLLIIVVPILVLLEWLIQKDFALMPEKKDLWIRKWRIFLTLFLATVLMGGDLITLLNTYFSGEISERFVYKVLMVILVAGVIGKYYFFSLYENFRRAATARRLSFWVGIVLVVVSIIMGFLIVGSPAKQRNLRFDMQRESDLSNIQWQIINYWQRKEVLPASLDELKDNISYQEIPTDPKTEQSYEYNVLDSNSFELCADFALETQDTKGRGAFAGRGGVYPTIAVDSMYPGGEQSSWKHTAGRNCFTRDIDPELYPPYPKERILY